MATWLTSTKTQVGSNGRKSLDAASRAGAQPGLPSPAPSEELVNSPQELTAADDRELPNAQTAISRKRRPPNRQPVPQVPNAEAAAPVSGNSRQEQARPTLNTNAVNTTLASQQPLSGTTPVHAHRDLSPTTALLGQLTRDATVPSQTRTTRTPTSQLEAPEDMFLPQVMLAKLNALSAQMVHANGTSDIDKARLNLLREAVTIGDTMYIVLNQLSCLRSIWPHLLPPSLQQVDPRSFALLDGILCGNDRLNQVLVQWMAAFAAPIMAIHASTRKAPFEQQVETIYTFLQRMPVQWPKLIQESVDRRAPPLTQDMVEKLRLHSPVLQTTAFRYIARLCWDNNNEEPNQAFQHLETVHRVDQADYYAGRRRDIPAVEAAYTAFRSLFLQHQVWKQRVAIETLSGGHSLHQPNLAMMPHLPSEVAMVFGRPTQVVAGISSSVPGQPRRTSSVHSNAQSSMVPSQSMPSPYGMAQAQQLPPRAPAVNRHRSSQSVLQSSPPNATVPPPLMSKRRYSVFPRAHELPRAQPTHPDTARSALHQARIRSPALESRMDSSQRLFRHVVGFALAPAALNKVLPVQSISFDVSDDAYSVIPETTSCDLSAPSKRTLNEESQMYRLRCSAIPSVGSMPTESTWVVTDNIWPENLQFSFNSIPLEPRRKLHHGRYLPIDLTSYVKQGTNKLEAFINRRFNDTAPFSFAVAVELVGVMSLTTLTSLCATRTLSADEGLTAITRSLSGASSSADDDDVAVMSSNMTIKLFDPFSGCRIFDTPVRGVACLHRDPFDLATFLDTRPAEKPGCPSKPDDWKCPICKGDVRPQTLVIDGFLVSVREQLAQQGLLETRAIVVEADGSWMPKAEERTGVASASPEPEAAARKERVVIELDDSD